MKNLRLLTAALAVLLLSGPGAFALSTETHSTVNGNSSSNFSDPDEQAPPGLTAPDSTNNNVTSRPGFSVTGPNVPQMMGVDQGQQQFDNAYNHLSNQNK